MRVACPNCNKRYEIPEEFLPKDKAATFHCKACKNFVRVEPFSSGDKLQQEVQSDTNADTKDDFRPAQEKGGDLRADGEALKKKILQSLTGVLPAMPQIIVKAQEIMSNQNSNLKQLAQVIATDQAISIRVLKLANSAYYGMSGKVTSLGQASVLLGTKRIGEVITMAGAFSFLDKKLKGYGLDSGELWRHSLAGRCGRVPAHSKSKGP
jgi:c-di-GMP-related signal transduction protein